MCSLTRNGRLIDVQYATAAYSHSEQGRFSADYHSCCCWTMRRLDFRFHVHERCRHGEHRSMSGISVQFQPESCNCGLNAACLLSGS